MAVPGSADLAYVSGSNSGLHTPVLVIHSWWGLTSSFVSFADHLAARGFLVGCADLYDGAVPETEDDARRLGARRREPVYKRLRRGLEELRSLDQTPQRNPAVVGFSKGGHWAVWLAQHPDPPVDAVVLYYAARGGDFTAATAPVLAHFAADDEFVSVSVRGAMEQAIAAQGLLYAAHEYPNTKHWFAESDSANFNPEAAGLAFSRTSAFLASPPP